jgi:hypothetical protein
MKPATHVQFDIPLEFIIISYCPGSFGSILYHSLNTAPEIGNVNPQNMFVAQDGTPTNGGAHNVTCEIFGRIKEYPIGPFHDGDEVDPWITGTDEYRRQYLLDNVDYDWARELKTRNPQRQYYLHRWVVPNAEHLVSKYLNCRIIGVIVEDQTDFDITVDMHVKKSLSINLDINLLPKLKKNNPLAHQIFLKLGEQERRAYLYNVSRQRIKQINTSRAYDIGIRLKHFLDHDAYMTRIKEISGFLDIHPDYDQVSRIYKDFHAINQIDRICYDHSI